MSKLGSSGLDLQARVFKLGSLSSGLHVTGLQTLGSSNLDHGSIVTKAISCVPTSAQKSNCGSKSQDLENSTPEMYEDSPGMYEGRPGIYVCDTRDVWIWTVTSFTDTDFQSKISISTQILPYLIPICSKLTQKPILMKAFY